MKDGVISRIGRVEAENIRGLIGRHSFDLDADLVILTGPNGFGKTSLIDAICLALTGAVVGENRGNVLLSHGKKKGSVKVYSVQGNGEACIEIRLASKKERPELLSGAWTPHLDPQNAARITAYSQEILDQVLGDEENRESIVRKLLQPPPEPIQAALRGINTSLKHIDMLLREWTALGVESEELIQKDRKAVIKTFRESWIRLQKDISDLPKLSSDAFLSLKSDNLRKNWEGELRKLTEETIKQTNLAITLDTLDKNKRPSGVLAVLERSLKAIRDTKLTESKMGQAEPYSNALNIIEDLRTDTQILCVEKVEDIPSTPKDLILPLSASTLKAVSSKIEEEKKERAKVQQILRDLRMLLEGSDSGQGGFEELLRWLDTARTNGQHWISLTKESMPDPPGVAPPIVAEWLEEMLSKMEEPYIQLEKWIESARERTEVLKEDLLKLEQQINEQQSLLELGRLLVVEVDGLRPLKEELLKVQRVSIEFLRTTLAEQRDRDSQRRPAEGDIGFRRLLEAIVEWRNVEERGDARRRALEQQTTYRKMREKVEDVQSALKKEQTLQGVLRSLQDVPPTARDAFVENVNVILDRFHLVPGITPIQIKPSRRQKDIRWRIELNDGRSIVSLSTGQKALLGIATMVSLNLASSNILNHRILLFDDITTALDMAQLPRAAVLIRQLAYADSTREAFRRQVILSSHHEEMTHRLLDYLLPPPGRSLKVVNFMGWDYDNGPSYEILEGKPRCDSLDCTTELLERCFDQLWGEKQHKQM